ncbi:haloacid dehalogenase type II [Nocardioides sp.]|uniref:haloacid dehalogenase type II n=1 Tax=Nocardioides sp. TaxID=35761 RepID=UPI00351210D5
MSSNGDGVRRPELIVLDVNETLSDLSPMADAFTAAGLDAAAVEPWFAGVLRDAFALTVLGQCPSFLEIADASLQVRLAARDHDDPAGAAAAIVERFAALEPHADVVPGLRALAEIGCRIVTLSNGSARVAQALLGQTPAAEVIEHYLSVDDAGAWKPAAAAYEHALARTGVEAGAAMLVAVHPWDIAGARAAGLRTAWISRDGAPYPTHMPTAEIEARSLVGLAQRLDAAPR